MKKRTKTLYEFQMIRVRRICMSITKPRHPPARTHGKQVIGK